MKTETNCSVCLNSIISKNINYSVQLECGHYFHNHCIKQWCNKCVKDNKCSKCPLCRSTISNEYLDILGIDLTSCDNYNLMTNTVQLFTYIMKNKIYDDEKKLSKCLERYPDEIENIMNMLEFYIFMQGALI